MQGMTPDQLKQTPVQMNLGGAVVQGVVDPYTGRFTESAVGAQVPSPAGVEEQKIRIAQASRAPGTTVNVGPGEKAFDIELSKNKAQLLKESLAAAEDAESITDTINIGRQLLNAGMVTGAGAEYLVNFGQALKQVGIDVSSDATANSQAYAAAMANNVGRIIKLFGAGTGLSNADREYAEKMAGGKITLDERALRRILDINERLARNTISRHNARVDKFGAGEEMKVQPPATTVAPRALPTPGAVVDGYRFKGGDPSKESNWEKVTR
jgi:hypothetical protein